MTPDSALVAARIINDARRLKIPLNDLPKAYKPETIQEGYQVQHALKKLLRTKISRLRCGHKIGCTTTVMQEYLQIGHPCAGVIMDETIYNGSAQLQYSNFIRPGIECEIVVRLGTDIPEDIDFGPEEIGAYIDSIMIGIELVDDRYVDFRSLGTPTLIADNFFNAGCILGKPNRDWRKLDLKNLTGGFSINGNCGQKGRGAEILGDPLAALVWLARHTRQTGGQLKAGDFVMLGSIVKTHWFTGPGNAVAKIRGLGEVFVTFS